MIAQESRSEPQTVEPRAVGERHRLGVAGSCCRDRLATSGTVGAKEGRIAFGKLGRGGTVSEIKRNLLLSSSGCKSRLIKVEQTGQ
jgi:hypothetical protein